jgi:2-polyprenyl-3-methyl-5-hydroxy-6-metoxy-1,4-benzoquinol methylase
MRYRICSLVIPSEITAKPPSRASSYVLQLIRDIGHVRNVLDYGCGKLRYAKVLASISDSLTLVDSERQLDRVACIAGAETTVRTLAARLFPEARIQSIAQFQRENRPRFDFALCANVLSAIPSLRARMDALASVRCRLKRRGTLLLINQHSNSFYSATGQRGDAIRHLDGWIIPRGETASYYGLINRAKAKAILESAGFKIMEHWIAGQSNYALARAQ